MKQAPSVHDLDRNGITDRHKLHVAECVIAWAKCESLLRGALSAIEGKPLDQGARDYSRVSPEDAWKKIKKAMRKLGATDEVLKAIQDNREASRPFYEIRKTVVHAGCIGVWRKDPEFLLFAPFESERAGEMIVTWIPLADLQRSALFADASARLAHQIMSDLGH